MYRTLQQGEPAVTIADDKTVLNQVDQALHRQQKSTWKPAPDHPWRRPLTRIKQQYLIMNMKRGHYCFGEKGTFEFWVDTHYHEDQAHDIGFGNAYYEYYQSFTRATRFVSMALNPDRLVLTKLPIGTIGAPMTVKTATKAGFYSNFNVQTRSHNLFANLFSLAR